MPGLHKSTIMLKLSLGFLLLSGCAAQPHNNEAGNQTIAPAPNTAPSNKDAPASEGPAQPAAEPADPQSDQTAGTEPAVSSGSEDNSTGTAAQKPEDAPVKEKLYKMSKAYRFEPISKETADKVVLLTFDDGPKEDKMISGLLDTLDKHKAKAIFFVNGYRVKKHPELLKKIADRGQTIGNHSWDHIDLKKESVAAIEKQVGDVQNIVKETLGFEPVFFRPPFGSGGDKVRSIVNKKGMLYTTWSNGSLDWDTKSTKEQPDLVIKNVLEQLHPGANILMHELPWTVEALDTLLTRLEEKGYGFIDPQTIDLGLDQTSK
ncbi:polysaccharide deacetylase family protein [Paenibacillus sepulcri]